MVLLASSTRRSVSPQDADGDDCDDDYDGKETDHQAEVNNCDAVVGVLTIHLKLRHSRRQGEPLSDRYPLTGTATPPPTVCVTTWDHHVTMYEIGHAK